MLWVYIVQCKCGEINRVLPCLITAALRATEITQKYLALINYIILSTLTTWRRHAMTIDMIEIMTSPHPMYNT